MKFPYQAYPRKRSVAFPDRDFELVPYIPIRVKSGDKAFSVNALVDSGASHCLFPGSLGMGLGLDVESGPTQSIYGLGQGAVIAHFHDIVLKLGGFEWKVYAGFSMHDLGTTGLLGQSGFFQNLRVTFDRSSNSIIINRRNLIQRLLTSIGC